MPKHQIEKLRKKIASRDNQWPHKILIFGPHGEERDFCASPTMKIVDLVS
jgi:hypothetical protein